MIDIFVTEANVSSAAALLFFFLQIPGDPVRSIEEIEKRADAQALSMKRNAERMSEDERHEFAERYDRLITALRKFETEYRKGDGTVWPKRAADELSKAMRAFEKTASWKHHEKLARE